MNDSARLAHDCIKNDKTVRCFSQGAGKPFRLYMTDAYGGIRLKADVSYCPLCGKACDHYAEPDYKDAELLRAENADKSGIVSQPKIGEKA